MNVERYSDLTKTILQVAQTTALGAGHARLEPVHVLQAMLVDADGLARVLIQNAGGDVAALDARVQSAAEKLPRVSGEGAQLALAPSLQKLLARAEQIADKAQDRFVTVENLLLAMYLSLIHI